MKLALMPMSELIRRMIVEPTDPAYAAEIDRRMPMDEGIEGALDAAYPDIGVLSRTSAAGAHVEMERVIDERPCEPLTDEDCNWGEQDSLANVPKRGAALARVQRELRDQLGWLTKLELEAP